MSLIRSLLLLSPPRSEAPAKSTAAPKGASADAVAAVDRVNEIRREIDELLASGVYEEQDPVVQALRADLAAAERRLAALRVRTSLT
jgi:hypothetical protein